jgi:hypothetical protein
MVLINRPEEEEEEEEEEEKEELNIYFKLV